MGLVAAPPQGTRLTRAARSGLPRFLLGRVSAAAGLLLVTSVLVFWGTQILPGDAASAALGRSATPEAVAELRAELGLDRPAVSQYLDWLHGLATGDLGTSLSSREPVTTVIGDRMSNSLMLAAITLAVLVPLALLLGILSGVRRGTRFDHAVSGATLTLIAVPEFVTGTLLTAGLAVALGLLPAVSLVPPGQSPLADPSVLVLPVITLTLAGLAYTVRMVRAGVVEAMRSDYVQMARLNGIGERRVILRHALPNALAPTVQVLAQTVQWLVGGVVIIEVVFQYPGIGQGLVSAVSARDFPTVQAIAMGIAAFYIAVNIIADLVVALLIPKVRTALL